MSAAQALPQETGGATGGGEDEANLAAAAPPSTNTAERSSAVESESPNAAPIESEQASEHTTTETDTKNGVMQSFPPSHILEDGRLIYLPPPNAAERFRFFERSIARHGLLQADMEKSDESDESKAAVSKDVRAVLEEHGGGEAGEEDGETDNDKTAPKVHPLAIASARLESNGLNELNRAINLATLVSTGEFFSYTNVVDPSFETDATVAATANATASSAKPGGEASSAVADYDAAARAATGQRTEALFSLKRKRAQFERATEVLERHEARLWAGVKAQHVIDRRLFQLRQQWRLVAPEHGTRAKLHAARTNEVIAVDVDVYDRDRVHGGNQALMGGSNKSRTGLAGRLASRVPRFATIELRDDFRVPERTDGEGDGEEKKDESHNEAKDNDDVNKKATDEAGGSASSSDTTVVAGNESSKGDAAKDPSGDQEMKDAEKDGSRDDGNSNADKDDEKDGGSPETAGGGDAVMEDATTETDDKGRNTPASSPSDKEIEKDEYAARWTRAEPFAVADPTLGRVIENFDPSKIPMLNLQLDIQKSSTGFLQSAYLEPMTTLSSARDGDDAAKSVGDSNSNDNSNSSSSNNNNNSDEELLISLQHSLFCANLFESMRSELDPDANAGNHAPPRGNSFSARRLPKAQQSTAWLASESEENFVAPPSFLVGGGAGRCLAPLSVVHCHEGEVKVQLDSEYQLCLKLVEANPEQTIAPQKPGHREPSLAHADGGKSGSQSPSRLHAFCRALLLYAQDVYHKHSLYLHEREKKMREDEAARGNQPRGLARIKKEDAPEKARILQSCVSLGSKMLFEQRIRKALASVSRWLETNHRERLSVEWLSLSIFDLHSRFTMVCRRLVVDGMISRDDLTITRIDDESGDHRKVHFRTDKEFELYLKLELERQLAA